MIPVNAFNKTKLRCAHGRIDWVDLYVIPSIEIGDIASRQACKLPATHLHANHHHSLQPGLYLLLCRKKLHDHVVGCGQAVD